jgi:hypothetical protein
VDKAQVACHIHAVFVPLDELDARLEIPSRHSQRDPV